jgi:hypothetical protein
MMTVVDDSFTAPGKGYPLHFSVVPGISHLNLGRTSRLYTPKLELIIPLSRLLLNSLYVFRDELRVQMRSSPLREDNSASSTFE